MTYSIVARDPRSGELGVAVQSRWPCVGAGVVWAEPGVGAVATQSFTEISYGPLGLEAMRAGTSAPDALADLLAEDPQAAVRQVGMVDAIGRSAAHTGDRCVEAAGHVTTENLSIQANMMERPTVWPAMAEAYRSTDGDLADRLLAALRAAEAEGGDVRGRQSSALLVVPGAGPRWATRFDLRVDDDRAPLDELARLLRLSRAYEAFDRTEELARAGDLAAAAEDHAGGASARPGRRPDRALDGHVPHGCGSDRRSAVAVRVGRRGGATVGRAPAPLRRRGSSPTAGRPGDRAPRGIGPAHVLNRDAWAAA